MPLIPDGWWIDEERRPELRDVLLAAYRELGQREDPPRSNRGPRIDVYTGLVGAPPSRPGFRWCVAFVRWCYTSSGFAFPRTWSVSELRDWAAANGHLVHGDVLPGDLFIVERRVGGEEHHHTGLVVRARDTSRFDCIEGNHGDLVAATMRTSAEIDAFIRLA